MANQENSHFIELASGVMALENSIFIENEYVKNKKESLEKLKTELQQIEREIELKEAIKKEIIEKEKHVDDNIKSVSNMRKMIRAHEHSLQYELEEEKKKTRSYNTKYQQSISKSENLWQEYEDTYNSLSYVCERNKQKSSLKLLFINLMKNEVETKQLNQKIQLLRSIQEKKNQNDVLKFAQLWTERNAFFQKRDRLTKQIEEYKKKIENMKAEKMQLFRTGVKRPYRTDIFGVGTSQFSVSIMELMQNGLALQTSLWNSPPRKIMCNNQNTGPTSIRGESTPAVSLPQAHDRRDTVLEQSAPESTITIQGTMPTVNHDTTVREHLVTAPSGPQGNDTYLASQQYEHPIIQRDERLSSVGLFPENQMSIQTHDMQNLSLNNTMEINDERSLQLHDNSRTNEDGSLKDINNRAQSYTLPTASDGQEERIEPSIMRNNEKSMLNQETSQNKNRTAPNLSSKTSETRPTTVQRVTQPEVSSTSETIPSNRNTRCSNSQITLQNDDQIEASEKDRSPQNYTTVERNGGSTVLSQDATQRENNVQLQDVTQKEHRFTQMQAEMQYDMRTTAGAQTASEHNILQGRRVRFMMPHKKNTQSDGTVIQNDGSNLVDNIETVRQNDYFLPPNNGKHPSRQTCENDQFMAVEIRSSSNFTEFQQVREPETETSSYLQTSVHFAQSNLFPDNNLSGQAVDSTPPDQDKENNSQVSMEQPTMVISEANIEQTENINAQLSPSFGSSDTGAVWDQHQNEVDTSIASPEGYTIGNFNLSSPVVSYDEQALSPASLIISPEQNDKNCNNVSATDNQNNTNTGFNFNFGSSTSNFTSNMSSMFQNQDNNQEKSKMGGLFSLF